MLLSVKLISVFDVYKVFGVGTGSKIICCRVTVKFTKLHVEPSPHNIKGIAIGAQGFGVLVGDLCGDDEAFEGGEDGKCGHGPGEHDLDERHASARRHSVAGGAHG